MKRWPNGFGGEYVQLGRVFKAQKSGHGHWCELQIWLDETGRSGRFEWWGDAHTGKTINWFFR